MSRVLDLLSSRRRTMGAVALLALASLVFGVSGASAENDDYPFVDGWYTEGSVSDNSDPKEPLDDEDIDLEPIVRAPDMSEFFDFYYEFNGYPRFTGSNSELLDAEYDLAMWTAAYEYSEGFYSFYLTLAQSAQDRIDAYYASGGKAVEAADVGSVETEPTPTGDLDPQGEPELENARLSNTEIVLNLYSGLLDRDPDQAGFDYWIDFIEQEGDAYLLVRSFVYVADKEATTPKRTVVYERVHGVPTPQELNLLNNVDYSEAILRIVTEQS